MSRVTKLLVIVSNLFALWLLTRLVSRGVPYTIFVPTLFAFGVACLAAAFAGDVVASVVLTLVYFVPAAAYGWFNNFGFPYYAIWLAALCGAMTPKAVRSNWAFPGRWNGPLVLWALSLALSWPIVLLRELDFVPALLDHRGSLWSSRLGIAPQNVAIWTLSVTTISMTGLLFLDWLFLVFPFNRIDRFERRIVWPLFAAAVLAAAVAVYQSFVDMSFLNRTLFGTLGRAVGTMRDANPFGMIAALWVPAALALAIGADDRRRWLRPLWALPFFIVVLGMWASGSRTALLAALVGLAVQIATIRSSLSVRHLLAGVAAVAALLVVVAFLVPRSTTGPWRRVLDFVPGVARADLASVAQKLWTRDYYGTAAVRMIADHPLVGVGVGGFHYLYSNELYFLYGAHVVPPDNAQNWYRHQLAEIGLFGSVGWIVFTTMFVWLLARGKRLGGPRALVGAAKGAVIGLGVASLVGMPTQDAAASITFVVLACWCLKLLGVEHAVGSDQAKLPTKREWAAILAVLGCFLAGTAYSARNELRPPYRAVRANYQYKYGFSAPDEEDPEFRWTGARAVDVFPAQKRWLKVVIGDAAPDSAGKPVAVRVWFNRQLILRVMRQGSYPITKWIRLPDDHRYVVIEIEVGRTWRPSDFGLGDDRNERGIAVANWVFTDVDPPKGSLTVE